MLKNVKGGVNELFYLKIIPSFADVIVNNGFCEF